MTGPTRPAWGALPTVHRCTPPRRGVSLLLAPLLALAAFAGLDRATWEAGDGEAIRRATAGDEAGTLLAATLEQGDVQLVLRDMRRLTRLPAPDWMRGEALAILCEYFCVMEMRDSLVRRSAELAALRGHPFDCPLVAPAGAGGWWVQVGAFSTEAAARAVLRQLDPQPLEGRVVQEGGLWKARLGPSPSRREAERTARALREAGRIKDYRLVEE
jgi:hypothetical protein